MHLSRLYFSNILKHHLASSSLQHPLFCRIWKKKTTTWSSSYKMSNASCRNLAVLETRTLRSCCSCRKHWGQKSQTCTNFMNKLLPPFAKSLTASKHLLTVQIHSLLWLPEDKALLLSAAATSSDFIPQNPRTIQWYGNTFQTTVICQDISSTFGKWYMFFS